MIRITGLFAACVIVAASIGCATRRASTTPSVPSGPLRATTTAPGVIPAGTTVAIRTNERISTGQAGQTYSAQVAENIENQQGRILVPRGSAAELVVVDSSGGGTIGTPRLTLGVRSVTVNGTRYAVTTGAWEKRGEEGIGANRRTAEMVGGGAALGALIGAAAGGGRGAAIGAIAGAAAGAATQVVTNGDKVEVPAETLLTFRLADPWRLQS